MKATSKVLFGGCMLLVLGLITLGTLNTVYGQEDVGTDLPPFPVGVNETTLTIAVIGGVSGAIIANVWGKNEKDNKNEKWDLMKFVKTFVFSMLTGVPTVLTFTGIFEITTTTAIQAVLLWVYATTFVLMIERARQKS